MHLSPAFSCKHTLETGLWSVSVFLGLAEKSWALQTPISSLIIGEEKEQKMAKLLKNDCLLKI